MQIYNSRTRKIEPIKPIKPPHLGFYACGFTVYDYAHLGHLRRYTLDDILIRTLQHAGFEVKFVQNVTDVGHLASDADTGEDKMEKGAKKYQTTVWDVAKKFENFFYMSMDEMGNLRPDVICRATEHITEQLKMVKQLEAKGFAYVIEGDGVYFDTSKVDDYGQLSPQDMDSLKEGARVELVSGKRHPSDFALWKFEREGENRAMVWPSPWSERSFPGWHIECSAMSIKYLGEQFDIHTGGMDHLTIHHPNEIAQSEAATGKKPFVKYWVHHKYLRVEGEKMSKSLENFFTIEDVKERGFHPLALRLLFLTAHYRSEMNFTWDNLAGAQKSYQKLINTILQLQMTQNQPQTRQDQPQTGQNQAQPDHSQLARELRQQFFELMTNDLDTPEAMAVVWEVAGSDKLFAQTRLELLLDFDQVLGLGLDKADEVSAQMGGRQLSEHEVPTKIKKLLEQRQEAREKKDFTTADQLRDQIQELGYTIEDTTGGVVVKVSTLDLSRNKN